MRSAPPPRAQPTRAGSAALAPDPGRRCTPNLRRVALSGVRKFPVLSRATAAGAAGLIPLRPRGSRPETKYGTGAGSETRSTRKGALSMSPHCRSSISSTIGRLAASLSSSSRRAWKPRNRNSAGLAISTLPGVPATFSSTGNSRISAKKSERDELCPLCHRKTRQVTMQAVHQTVERFVRHDSRSWQRLSTTKCVWNPRTSFRKSRETRSSPLLTARG